MKVKAFHNPIYALEFLRRLMSKSNDEVSKLNVEDIDLKLMEPIDLVEAIKVRPDPYGFMPDIKAIGFLELVNEAMVKQDNGDDDAFLECHDFVERYPFNVSQLLALIRYGYKVGASGKALEKALQRLENDPKQKALDEIEVHYQDNKAQFKRRGYSAQFTREMHEKYPIITSIKTIEKLVANLNKENELIPR